MPRKGDMALGLEAMLNRKDTSILHNPQVIKELHAKSGMSLRDMISYVGKNSRANKKGEAKGPTDKERSEARVDELEAKAEKKE
jgi:hypothetical protein